MKLGYFLGDGIGLDANEAVRVALEQPGETLLAWQALASSGPTH